MRYFAVLLAACFLVIAGCEYEAPLTDEHSIPIDSAVLGLWELIPEEGNKPKPEERAMVLKYSDTEYLIHYPLGEEGMYFRGYLINIGGISCIQVERIGSASGPPDEDDMDRFHVVSYKVENGNLVVKILNTDLVDDGLKDSKALKKAFLKHKDNESLFRDPGIFRRVKRKS